MSSRAPFRPCPGGGGRGCGPLPAPPFNPTDYWATRKWVSAQLASVEYRPLAGMTFRLETNGDLYSTLSAVVTALGGEVEE